MDVTAKKMVKVRRDVAERLEALVRKLYGCERCGIAGMADAAVLIVAYVYADGGEIAIDRYRTVIFDYGRELIYRDDELVDFNDEKMDKIMEGYLQKLSEIVGIYS